MLSFVDNLKQVIADIQITGGAPVEHSAPSSSLLQKLREYALQRAENRASEWTLLEWFTEGFFDEYVRVCVVHLRKLGISDANLVFKIIAKVVDLQLSAEAHRWERKEEDFEERLAFSLIDIWEQMGDEQTLIYTFAQERWLIAWDYQKSYWKVTSLGQSLLELSPVQAATFLLSIDTLFSTGRRDFRHISAEVLNSLLHPQPDEPELFHLIPLHRDILTRLGILREPDDYVSGRIELTPVGKVVLRRVLDKDNPLRDKASALIETEETEKGVKRLEDWQAGRTQAIERGFNPYISGGPIREPDMFFGREELLKRITNTLHNNSIMIHGPRRIGKTSLLYQLADRLRATSDPDYVFIPALIDLEGTAQEEFFHTLMEETLEDCQPYLTERLPLAYDDYNEKDEAAYTHRDFARDLSTVIDHLRQNSDKEVRLILLLDEVDVMNRYDQLVQQQLRRIFMKTFARNLGAVVAGVHISKEWERLESPWYNFFLEMDLLPLSREEAVRLIKEPVKDIYSYEDEAVKAIWEYSQGHPQLVQQLCLEAVNQLLQEKRSRVTKADVESVYREIVAWKRVQEKREERERARPLVKRVAEEGPTYEAEEGTDVRRGDR